jgi:hypothetical protein
MDNETKCFVHLCSKVLRVGDEFINSSVLVLKSDILNIFINVLLLYDILNQGIVRSETMTNNSSISFIVTISIIHRISNY